MYNDNGVDHLIHCPVSFAIPGKSKSNVRQSGLDGRAMHTDQRNSDRTRLGRLEKPFKQEKRRLPPSLNAASIHQRIIMQS